MPVFPGDPEVTFKQILSIRESGYNVSQLCVGTHAGTHVDVPHHVLHDSRTTDRMPLDSVIGWAEVLDLTDKQPREDITAADLDPFADRIGEGARVLLKTGWGRRFGQPEFFKDFPGVTEGAALWLNARKVKLLGLEQPSVHSEHHLPVHKALLASGMVIVETMANLDQLTRDRVFLIALPLNVVGLDGCPMRVVAIEGEPTEF